MQEKYNAIKEIKVRTDFLLLQLSEGKYASLDAYINNLVHLKLTYSEFKPFTVDLEFLKWLQNSNPTLLTEIVMTGRIMMALQNFFKLAES
ncbi:hypothetical protein [Pantoea agglomerans]|jgi:hypothetical protein|uniref:hypothetical protein n=1 Tax=Enterobacter agglomerans TaxID=549 RepID=UPI003FD0C4EC